MSAAPTTPPLRTRVAQLATIGLPIGLSRYGCEFVAPDVASWFGVYYLMPAVFVVVAARGAWGRIGFLPLLATMALTCLIVWGAPNTLAYTTGQFLEWNHGRFYSNGWDDDASRAAPIADTAAGKVLWGVAQGLLTSVAGTVWCTLWGAALIWLPARLRPRPARP